MNGTGNAISRGHRQSHPVREEFEGEKRRAHRGGSWETSGIAMGKWGNPRKTPKENGKFIGKP